MKLLTGTELAAVHPGTLFQEYADGVLHPLCIFVIRDGYEFLTEPLGAGVLNREGMPEELLSVIEDDHNLGFVLPAEPLRRPVTSLEGRRFLVYEPADKRQLLQRITESHVLTLAQAWFTLAEHPDPVAPE